MNAIESVNKIIVDTLIQGTIPWKTFSVGFPTNVLTNRRYGGINPILLQISALKHNFNRSSYWGSVQQWKAVQCRVPFEVEATPILVYQELEKENKGKTTRFKLPSTRKIFNTDQVIGLTIGQFMAKTVSADYGQVNEIIEKSGVKIQEGLTPLYEDGKIYMPPRSHFHNDAQYWATHLHELSHHWELKVGFIGDGLQRELVAEIATGYLEGILRLEHCSDRKNHDKYLALWLDEIKENPKYLIQSASIASRIVYDIMHLLNPKEFPYAE